MAQVNPLTRELLVKLVYYGPGLGGKTSSLQRIHASSPAETRGQIVSLATPVDRTLYFDFLPLRAQSLRGHHVRLQLFTVPGQVYFNATRKLVLTGADGIVFVADSQRERHDANLESLENLAANLEDQGRALADVPLVFQYNKRDLPTAMPKDELDLSLNALGVPSFGTNAATGENVLESLDSLVRAVLDDLEKRNVLGAPVVPTPEPKFARTEVPLEEQIGRASAEYYVGPDVPPPTRTVVPPPGRGADQAPNGSLSAPRASTKTTIPPVRESQIPPRHGPSFVAHFPGEELEAASIESSLERGQYAEALVKCDQLVRTLFRVFAIEIGAPDESPALLLPLLSLDVARWLAFQRLVARASAGPEITEREALRAYALAIELRAHLEHLTNPG